MEKTTGHICPRCRRPSLNVYYEDDADVKLGALCESCGLKGYYVEGCPGPVPVS
jgi:hypothetical protein